jgi:hypothetical protein
MSTMKEASGAPAGIAPIDIGAENSAIVPTAGRRFVATDSSTPFPVWYAACVGFARTHREGRGSTMTTTATSIVQCPECGSDGEMLHHDPRASLVYACKVCLHEWEMEVVDELVEVVLSAAQPPPKQVARSKRSRRP